jgi:hypothetical protein
MQLIHQAKEFKMPNRKANYMIILGCLVILFIFSACAPQSSSTSYAEELRMGLLYREQNRLLVPNEADYYYPFNEKQQNSVYEYLFYYEWKTGKVLTLDDVKEYLSSEFEEDGSVRIYNNGNWPEIEEYVNWCLEHKEDIEAFDRAVIKKMVQWGTVYPELAPYEFYELSLHNLNEIMLTIKDESYEPNFIFE